MTKLNHLQAIADALIELGYEVEEPRKNCEYLDVWGYETREGKRRRKCFEEIYCMVVEVGKGEFVSYWSTNKTYDNGSDNIGVSQSDYLITGIGSLVDALSVEPLKRKAKHE